MSHLTDPELDSAVGNSATRSRLPRLSSLGIRASFLFGFGVMTLIMLLVAATALFITTRVSQSINEIFVQRLPVTVELLRAARAVDTLAATGAVLITVNRAADRSNVFARVENAQTALDQALTALSQADSSARPGEIYTLSLELAENFRRMRQLVNQRISLIQAQEQMHTQLAANLQEFQQHLTYRIRILQGDSDMMTMLLSQPSPPLERIADMAKATAPLIPLARYLAEIEAIGGQILSTAQAPDLSALELSRQILETSLLNASRTADKLPSDMTQLMLAPFARLHEIALGSEGLVALKENELRLLDQGLALNAESQLITARVDTVTSNLVNDNLNDITQAGNETTVAGRIYRWLLFLVTGLALLGMAAFMYLHVRRHLIARLGLLSQSMQEIAAGRLDAALPRAGPDELGRLGAAVHQFRNIARELVELNVKLSALSTEDFLTGLANRRRFDEALTDEWARAKRNGQPLAMIMLDVDHFKQFNDHYGHQAGDECLRQIGNVLKSQVLRAGDLAARYGGEEFGIVFSADSLDAAVLVGEKIRTAIAALDIKQAVPPGGPGGVVTASLGVALLFPDRNSCPDELVRAADKALYQAKSAGRNRIVSVQVPSSPAVGTD
ncbi:MAG: diguanylate cyclase [Pseudomonadales bacterium]|nr:diguanylate cyclase [Pseudomonadales bacterium]